MRRTYPQFLASGGESMPPEVLSVIFPLQYWSLISKYAAAHKLDPYLVAALIAQESTFDKDIVSSAKAIGLMQIMPTTGRRWARRLGIRNFSTRRLTVPDINVRIGTAYFDDLVRQFGSEHAALAAYNAGESRVVRWQRTPGSRATNSSTISCSRDAELRAPACTAEDYRRFAGAEMLGGKRLAAGRESLRGGRCSDEPGARSAGGVSSRWSRSSSGRFLHLPLASRRQVVLQ
jgi:soluble lytic murein transglycosylase